MAHRIVGQTIARLDGMEKVTGAARYSADVKLPGLCWGKALRSPLPHARIVRIDTSKAKAYPGVHAVITHEDVPKGQAIPRPALAPEPAALELLPERALADAESGPGFGPAVRPADARGEGRTSCKNLQRVSRRCLALRVLAS